MIGNDETNFSHKLLLTNRQVSNHKTFANHLSADIKLSKLNDLRLYNQENF